MSFFDHIEKMRGKSEETRRQLTFWFSAGITGLVALVWVASLSFTLRTTPAQNVAAVGSLATSTDDSVVKTPDTKTKIIEGWKVITNQN